jgi:hypothetical protein
VRVSRAVLAALAAVAVGVGVGSVAAGVVHHPDVPTARPAGSSSPSASVRSATPRVPASPIDQLSGENLVRERLYHDVTGHSFSLVPIVDDPNERLGACTGDKGFSDFLPSRNLPQLETILAGSDVLRVTEQIVQTGSASTARTAADRLVAMVRSCPGVQGGDFGYGAPVVVESGTRREVVYFPGFDGDRRHGGYIVFSVGTRVGVIDVADRVGEQQVAHLAREAAGIADD